MQRGLRNRGIADGAVTAGQGGWGEKGSRGAGFYRDLVLVRTAGPDFGGADRAPTLPHFRLGFCGFCPYAL